MKQKAKKANDKARAQKRQAVTKPEPTDVTSLEQLRFKYLPDETKQRSALKRTPSEIGAELARKSLSTARQALLN